MLKRFLLLGLVLGLTACIPTVYEDAVNVVQVNDRNFLIRAQGDGYTDPQTVQEYTLLRAAELCLANGFAAFRIASSTNEDTLKTGFWDKYLVHGRSLQVSLLTAIEAEGLASAYDCASVKSQFGFHSRAQREEAEKLYQTGLQLSKEKGEHVEAVQLWRKAVELGHNGALYSLGWAYENGRGVTQDNEQAIYWYSQAAARGSDGAKGKLKELKK